MDGWTGMDDECMKRQTWMDEKVWMDGQSWMAGWKYDETDEEYDQSVTHQS